MKTNILVYPEDLWLEQEQHIAAVGVESMAFGFVGINVCNDKNEYLVFDNYLPADDEFSKRSIAGISLKVDSVCEVLKRVKQSTGLLDIHTHPTGMSHFSSTDNCGHQIQMQNVFDFSPNGVLIRVVKERNNFRAEVTNPELQPKFEPVDIIKIIGNKGIRFIYPVNSRVNRESINTNILEHHKRTLEFYKQDALSAIRASDIGIIGTGGNGAAIINTLKFFPFKKWVLVDNDIIEEHNSNRFFGYNDGDVGKQKVNILKRELQRFDPSVEVETINTNFPDEISVKALKGCDILFVSPDNNSVRYTASQFAIRYLKPLLELGSGITMKDGHVTAIGSQVRFQIPSGSGKCIVCNGLDVKRLESKEINEYKKNIGYITDTEESPGSVVTINSMAASLAAHLLLDYFGNYIERESIPSYLSYDEKNLTLTDLSSIFKKNPDCTICGRHSDSLFGKGDILPASLEVLAYEEAAENIIDGE